MGLLRYILASTFNTAFSLFVGDYRMSRIVINRPDGLGGSSGELKNPEFTMANNFAIFNCFGKVKALTLNTF